MAPPNKEKQASNVFIRDEVYGWRPAVQEKINGDKAIVTVPEYSTEQAMACDGGRAGKKGTQMAINLKEYPSGVLPLQNVDSNGNLVECSDMVKLPYLHEVCIVLLKGFFSSLKFYSTEHLYHL
jgi:hypothetical protein